MKKWKKFTVILLAMILALAMSVPVSAAMFPIDIGTTDDGDYIIGRNLTVVSGFEVDRNMYISPGGSYTFYGELTVHGNLYVLGDFYPMRRKTHCFSYGDIRRVHRIYASN